eukprot:Em0002g384a
MAINTITMYTQLTTVATNIFLSTPSVQPFDCSLGGRCRDEDETNECKGRSQNRRGGVARKQLAISGEAAEVRDETWGEEEDKPGEPNVR